MAEVLRTLAFCVVLALPATGHAQVRRDIEFEPPPARLDAQPLSETQARHYEGLRHFLRGQVLEHQSRYVDAIKAYEEALRCEEQPALYRALVPLCFALDRDAQGLECCRKASELDPDDYELLFRFARELQERGRFAESADALTRAVESPRVKDQFAQRAQMLFALATLREDLKQYDRAADAYEQVTKILDAPDGLMKEAVVLPRKQVIEEAARTYERWGRAEVLSRRFNRAVFAFQKAQQVDPARAGRLHYNLAEVYIAQKQHDEALASLQKYLATQPPGAEAYELLAGLLKNLGRTEAVIPALEQAVVRDGFNQPLKLLLAGEYAKAQEAKKAEAIYVAAMAEYPSEEAYRGLARLYQDLGRWEELAKKLDHDLSNARHFPSARPQLQVLTGDAGLTKDVATAARALNQGGTKLSFTTCRALATLCRQARHYDLAEYFCRAALPDDPQPGDVYMELCRVLSESGKYEAEAAVCKEAMTKKLRISSFLFQLEMARALALAGRDKDAVAAAQQAVQQTVAGSDEHFQARCTLATVYYRCHQLDRAEKECLEILEQRKAAAGQRQVNYLLAGIYAAAKNYPKAEEYLQKLLELDSQDGIACNDLGYLWAEQGKNLEEAEKLIRKAIDLDRSARAKRQGGLENPQAGKDNAAYIDSLAWVLFKRRQFAEARDLLERAAKLPEGDDPVIFEHLGEVYLALGLAEQANAAWTQALRLYEKSRRAVLVDRGAELREKLKTLRQATMR